MQKNLNILIISDNPIIAGDIKATLLKEGYLIKGVARWDNEAMDLIPLVKPDLIIADLLLKDGIGLADAAERINVSCSAPVVFIAGEEIKTILPELGLIQFSGYLIKPFSSRELQNTIEITYNNFLNSGKKVELTDYKHALREHPDEMGRKANQRLTRKGNTGMVQQLTELLYEISETFEKYLFGSEISLVILRRFGDIIYCNYNFSDMCGIPCSLIAGENIITFIDPQDKYNFWKILTGWAGTGYNNKAENRSISFDCSLNGAQNETIRLHICLEEFKDNQGVTCLCMISAASNDKDKIQKLQEKINACSYECENFEAGSFLKGLTLALNDITSLTQKNTPETAIKFRRSIFSAIGYSEHLMNGIDNLSNEEIKKLAGRINTYLRIIYSLSQDDDLDWEKID